MPKHDTITEIFLYLLTHLSMLTTPDLYARRSHYRALPIEIKQSCYLRHFFCPVDYDLKSP